MQTYTIRYNKYTKKEKRLGGYYVGRDGCGNCKEGKSGQCAVKVYAH